MIYDNDVAVKNIRNIINQKRQEEKLPPNEWPIREDIFDILFHESVVLYYPLEDKGIKGCHIEKAIGDEVQQFVFINTIKNVEEQTWTAAHELGHVWRVDRDVNEALGKKKVDSENIVNRFAAEILMPEGVFRNSFHKIYRELGLHKNRLQSEEFVQIVAYLMNYFCCPYKAVIRRFVETGIVVRQNEYAYIVGFESNLDYYHQLIKTNYYPRLGKVHKSCNMEHIGEDINEIEKLQLLSPEKIKRYREMFKIEEEKRKTETFDLGEGYGETDAKGRN